MTQNTLIPLGAAIILTVLIILVIPLDFDRYKVELRSTQNHVDFESIAFADLNGDGIDDLLECGGSNSNLRRSACACRIMDENGVNGTLDQINVPNLLHGPAQVAISDFDKNGSKEIWLASGEDDQLFLYGFDANDLSKYKYRFWIDSIYPQKGKYVASFNLHHAIDINGDGMDELFFYIGNQFPIYPRRTYRLDVANKEVVKSPITSVGFPVNDASTRGDGTIVFTSSSSSPGNHKASVNLPFPDTLGYVYAFDQELNFLFEPIPFSVYPSGTANYFTTDGILSFRIHRSPDSVMVAQRRALDGKLLENQTFPSARFIRRKSPNEFIIGSPNEIKVLDSSLQVQKTIELNEPIIAMRALDLNGDGKNELLCLSENQSQFIVIDHKLDAAVEFQNQLGRSVNFHLRQYAPNRHEFVAFGNHKLAFYRYDENPVYYFRLPYYLGVFLIAFLVSAKTFKYYRKGIEHRFDQEREFNRLQILSLKNQVDPHFALNALNSIDWMYKSGEGAKATKYMETYTRLMHQTVTSSDKITTKLYDELDFCRKFCELEKLRDPEFTYKIDVDDSIDSFEINVPRQILFTHVENAIKHGLRPKEGEKLLKITVAKSDSEIEVKVENNGVPFRKKSHTSGTGKGLNILSQMTDLYTSLTGKKVNSQIHTGEKDMGSTATIRLQI